MRTHRLAPASLTIALLLACGDDEARPLDASALDAPRPIDAAIDSPSTDARTGSITVRGASITGANSRILLVFVATTAGGPGSVLGKSCTQVSADPFAFSAIVQTFTNGDPCTDTPPATFADGTYAVNAGIYVPGQMMPERCATTTVTVAGTGDVTLPAFGACP
jgi:hypothetical protein